MKIKLSSNSEIARKIAMCFVGSDLECKNSLYKDSYLVATLDDSLGETGFVVRVLYDGCANLAISESITINPSTAKFDPFVACRERVQLKWEADNGTSLFSKSGLIETIGLISNFRTEDGSTLTLSKECLSIDVEHYRNIEGIEVIE